MDGFNLEKLDDQEHQRYSTPILLIAAGSSSRLGQPKQLLPYKNSTLLNYTLQECAASKLGPIHLVLGAHYELIFPTIDSSVAQIHRHKNWAQGMGSSIAFGVEKIRAEASKRSPKGIFIVLSDQAFFDRNLLNQLLDAAQKNKALIVASKYQKGSGPPVLFSGTLLEELAALTDDHGAKSIVQKYKDQVAFIEFPKGHIDIDCADDLKWLK